VTETELEALRAEVAELEETLASVWVFARKAGNQELYDLLSADDTRRQPITVAHNLLAELRAQTERTIAVLATRYAESQKRIAELEQSLSQVRANFAAFVKQSQENKP
jgi:predicted RNase H-like nuclease (RuvC/YqgF family)